MKVIQNSGKSGFLVDEVATQLQVTRPDGGRFLGLLTACGSPNKHSYLHTATRVAAFFSASELQRAVNKNRPLEDDVTESEQQLIGGIDR